MLFLADECCDSLIVRTLRELGHDVVYVAEISPGSLDEDILMQAFEQRQLVITEDRDICELVFRDNKQTFGIILVRIPIKDRSEKASRIKMLVENYADQLAHAMTTLTLANIKIRALPPTLDES